MKFLSYKLEPIAIDFATGSSAEADSARVSEPGNSKSVGNSINEGGHDG